MGGWGRVWPQAAPDCGSHPDRLRIDSIGESLGTSPICTAPRSFVGPTSSPGAPTAMVNGGSSPPGLTGLIVWPKWSRTSLAPGTPGVSWLKHRAGTRPPGVMDRSSILQTAPALVTVPMSSYGTPISGPLSVVPRWSPLSATPEKPGLSAVIMCPYTRQLAAGSS